MKTELLTLGTKQAELENIRASAQAPGPLINPCPVHKDLSVR
jgi:hypothetical protein